VAFEDSYTGGAYVTTGDVNGDGTPDVIVSPDEGGGPRVRVLDGKTKTVAADFFGIEDPNFRGGARVAVADVNGDGRLDVVVGAGFGGGPRVAGFDGKGLAPGGAAPPKLFSDFFVFEQTLRNGVFLTAGDLNGDGSADLIFGGGPGGGPRVFAVSGKEVVASGGTQLVQVANFFAGDVESRGGVRLTVKNFDGDNRADLVVGAGEGAGSAVTAYLGKNVPANGQPEELWEFEAFPGFSGGVYVG
jgi:hypothetical protein